MRWFADVALLPQGPARDVLLTVDDGRFTAVAPSTERPADAVLLPGVVVPGFANGHSHAFHRALRGRTHADGGTFWTWRERMYAVAARLDPDAYLALARAAYAEMALAGVTAVGEFHYLHHGPGGVAYDDPNQMAVSLRQAAREAGVRLTLLDVCYLSGGLDERGHLPLDPVQRRFADADAQAWAVRRELLVGAVARPGGGGPAGSSGPDVLVGAAAHSVRAVPRHALRAVADAAAGVPLHVHASEQPAENAACLAVHGLTPVGLLAAEGVLGPRTSVVHATHLTDADIAVLGATRTTACFCPTTERDLADGIGPARALLDAGAPLSLGSDSHAVVDLLEEARALESHERLASMARGRFSPAQLVAALTAHASIGWDDAGTLAVGARADLVAVRTDTVRTAGAEPAQVLYAASAADVDTVVVDGAVVVSGGQHVLGDVGRLLADAIEPLWAG